MHLYRRRGGFPSYERPFQPVLPRPGRYKVWVQVQRGGRVSTAAFVIDIAASVIVSVVTTPKPDSELVGLVYSLTPKGDLRHDDTGENAGWYRKPALLAGIALAMTIVLNAIF